MFEQVWVQGFLGGLMIGTAAALYLLLNGRILGASGILGGLVDGTARSTWPERAAFLLGLIAVPPLLLPLFPTVATHASASLWVLLAGGVLVGIGTRLANGCTSGHGVCGISRLAPRGILATLTFMAAGAATVALLRHVWGVI